MEADMTRKTLFGRAQALFELSAAVSASVRSSVSYICYLLVADDTTPMFPAAELQG
jgi:hypothetical protein